MHELQDELAQLQGTVPPYPPNVDDQAIASVKSVVADLTGIQAGRMVKNEIDSVLKLSDT